ncbi:MAG: glutathione S-transferase family protein [Gammaproteobacteria bacterium]|nr:glutathione S-transferase family protein [Gammaproteobacteria bacterium]
MLVLYHHGSSTCAAKVRFALEEKQLDWEGRYIDILAGEQFHEDFLKISPKGVVPVLIDDERVILESTIICEYLEDKFPTPALMPADASGKAKVRRWTKAVDEELHPACSAITYVMSHRHTILRNGAGSFKAFVDGGDSEGKAARLLKWQWIQEGIKAPGAIDKIKMYFEYLNKMETALSESEWLVGDAFTMADVAMTPYINRLAALAMEKLWEDGHLPGVERWFNAVKLRPTFESAFLKWLPAELQDEMYSNGQKSWPEIEKLIAAG